jgi:hypothetical protein
MRFILDAIENYCDGWRGAQVGPVHLLKYRDHVELETRYKHRRGVKQARRKGLYPLIIHPDGQRPHLLCQFKTGYLMGYSGFRELAANADGRLMKWEGQLQSWRRLDGYVYMASVPCDEAWLRHLEAISRSDVAVWRVSFEVRQDGRLVRKPAMRDFVVKSWNKRLIAEVLEGYSAILEGDGVRVAQAAKPQAPAARPKSSQPSQAGSAAWGPFRLMGDGSITEPQADLMVPAGAVVAEIRVRGYRLKSHVPGIYLLVDPQGVTTAVQFHEGRWRKKQVPPGAGR